MNRRVLGLKARWVIVRDCVEVGLRRTCSFTLYWGWQSCTAFGRPRNGFQGTCERLARESMEHGWDDLPEEDVEDDMAVEVRWPER